MNSFAAQWIDENQTLLAEANDTIWKFAEVALEEEHSSRYLMNVLKDYGFQIEEHVAGMDTAFIATWGSGTPCVGFLAEYDALPGLSQKVSGQKEAEVPGGAGHACGHNTFAAAVLGAVLGLKHEMQEGHIDGTIVFYGCPAEEILVGKVRMAKEHLFDRCDTLLTWHPNDISYVWARKSVALQSVKFNFHGIESHAGIDPWNGRSALDAVELMNVGANYLREHIPPTSKLHYVITKGGIVPNTVPGEAQVWYAIRSGSRVQVEELYHRIIKIAQGAALMTETTFDVEFISGCYDYLPNQVLAEMLLACMNEVGAPHWDDADRKFAVEISKQMPEKNIRAAKEQFDLKEDEIDSGLHTGIYQGYYNGGTLGAATDVGDASWQIPTGVFSFSSTVIGSPGHSWFYTACGGSTLGHKGAVAAAKVLALAGKRLLTEPDLRERAKAEFKRARDGREYHSPLE